MRIGLIGLGNAGSHLGRWLYRKHLGLQAVYSRTLVKAESFGKRRNIFYTNRLAELPADLDLYILAVPDQVIPQVARELAGLNPAGSVVHVAGATPSTVLEPYFKRYGVLYPLQTLTLGRRIKADQVPFCIEASDEELKKQLLDLAMAISGRAYLVSDAERAWLHVTAVMVNNFSNHLYTLAAGILDREGLDFDLLRPLILETARKVQKLPPRAAQTGPAARGDQKTIARHREMLAKYPDSLAVYKCITESLVQLKIKN